MQRTIPVFQLIQHCSCLRTFLLRTIYQNANGADNNISIGLIDGECNIYTIQNAKMVKRSVESSKDVIR